MSEFCDHNSDGRRQSQKAFLFTGVLLFFVSGHASAAQVMHPEDSTRPHFQRAAMSLGAAQARGSVFYELPELMLNVGSPTNGAFLKLRLTLEFEKESDLIHAERMKHRIVDNFIWFLRNMRLEDFEGPGLERVKQHLHARTDSIVAPAKLRSVLFKELIVQ